MGNGDEASGDGWKYRGRGAFQITGRENYQALTETLGVDLINHPELLETPQYAVISAGWYWNKRGLNKLADADDTKRVTAAINGGYNGLGERSKILFELKKVLYAV